MGKKCRFWLFLALVFPSGGLLLGQIASPTSTAVDVATLTQEFQQEQQALGSGS